MEHAAVVSDEQREELWQRARSVIQDLIDQNPSNPRSQQLEGQLASVAIAEATWMCGELLVRPYDESLGEQARLVLSSAIERLATIEKTLSEPPREAVSKRSQPGGPLAYEMRSLLHLVRWQIGLAYLHLAELASPDTDERTANIASSEQSLRRLKDVADEPLLSRSKVLLAACARLKGDFNRAAEMLTAIEKNDALPDPIRNEVIIERTKLLLANSRPDDAVQLLVKVRGKRQRLTGEMWFLQTKALIGLTEIATTRKQQALASSLSDQIKTTIDRCQDQVGGFWARRCQQLWDNVQTAQKYGAQLDGLMQQARNDFTAGRIESSLQKYAAAEKQAVQSGQTELAMELGFTTASILLDQKRFEAAAEEFQRLVNEYPTERRAARAHLLRTYSLGRLYDEKKTQQRREAYTEALDRHLQDYAKDETVNDARFLKAQLEEQRLQATQALPLYLDIDSNHPRAPEAAAGAARCYETILKRMQEQGLPADELKQESIDRLTRYLSAKGSSVDHWTLTHAEIALRLVSILLSNSKAKKGVTSTSNTDIAVSNQAIQESNKNDYALAERWLDQVAAYVRDHQDKVESADAIQSLRQRAEPLRTITLAARGKYADAERSINSFNSSDAVLFFVIDALAQLITAAPATERVSLARLQLKAASFLLNRKDALSASQRNHLDQVLMPAYLVTGESAKGLEILKRSAEASAKDPVRQREIAERLSAIPEPDAITLAKQCWRRVESLTKPGSSEWMSARLRMLRLTIQQQQFEEAKKLLQVTKVLYPDFGGDAFRKDFEAIEAELRNRK